MKTRRRGIVKFRVPDVYGGYLSKQGAELVAAA